MKIIVRYGVGYGQHDMDFEIEDDMLDEEIEREVQDAVMERLDWSWRKEP